MHPTSGQVLVLCSMAMLSACRLPLPLIGTLGNSLQEEARAALEEADEQPTKLPLPIEKLGVLEIGYPEHPEVRRCLRTLRSRTIIQDFVFLLEDKNRPDDFDGLLEAARAEARAKGATAILVGVLDTLRARSRRDEIGSPSPHTEPYESGPILFGFYAGAVMDVDFGQVYLYASGESRPWKRGRSTHLLPLEAVRSFCTAMRNRVVQIQDDQRELLAERGRRSREPVERRSGAEKHKDLELQPRTDN